MCIVHTICCNVCRPHNRTHPTQPNTRPAATLQLCPPSGRVCGSATTCRSCACCRCGDWPPLAPAVPAPRRGCRQSIERPSWGGTEGSNTETETADVDSFFCCQDRHARVGHVYYCKTRQWGGGSGGDIAGGSGEAVGSSGEAVEVTWQEAVEKQRVKKWMIEKVAEPAEEKVVEGQRISSPATVEKAVQMRCSAGGRACCTHARFTVLLAGPPRLLIRYNDDCNLKPELTQHVFTLPF
eukprot:363324-Chlamydomonas_euryale.AAC.15